MLWFQIFLGFLDLASVIIIGLLGALSISGVQSQEPGTRVKSVLDLLNLSDNSFQFTNTSNTNVGTLYYSWNFGDGSAISTSKNSIHSYNIPGTFPVKLVIVTALGCKDSIIKNIVIKSEHS